MQRLLVVFKSSHHNLLDVNALSIDKTKHIHARCEVDGLADAAADGLTAEDATRYIDNLQGGLTLVVDDPTAVAEESEVP